MRHIDKQSDECRVLVHGKHLIEIDTLDNLGLRANHGMFEPEETALCQQLINCDDRVLDIGAKIGYYTLLFCDLVSPEGHVTAIEPDQDNFRILKHNLANQATDKVVALHQIALGESTHTSQLFHAKENMGMPRLYASICCGEQSSEVAVVKGDNLALAPLDFIKIDIEGYEPAALHGLEKTIQQSPNLKILCEFSPLWLWEAGFSPIIFLKEICAYGLRPIVRDQQCWQPISFDEMERALELIPESTISPLIKQLQDIENQQVIHEQAQAFLEQHRYPRPLLENILFVAPNAWQTVCRTLHIPYEVNTIPKASTSGIQKKRWHCRWASEKDQDALLSLFQSAFNHAMPAELWAWKYADRSNFGVLAHREGQTVAYYGGLPRTLWIDGKKQSGVQICDVMVAPEERGILSRRGAFMQTTIAFLKASIGVDKTYQFAFGFPSGRHAKLGEKTGFYTPTDSLLETEWPVTKFMMTRFNFRMAELKHDDGDIINTQWQAMQQSLTDHMLPQKNTEFFKWRYLEHPTQEYIARIVSSRWHNKILGIFVLRDHGPDQGVELIDLLSAPANLNKLFQSAQNLTASMTRKRLFGWLTPAVLSWLPSSSTSNKVTDIYLYDGTPDTNKLAKRLQSKVWLIGGDTDFR